MRLGGKRWKKMIMAVMTAVLIGGMVEPVSLKATGLDGQPKTSEAATDTGTENADTQQPKPQENPADGTASVTDPEQQPSEGQKPSDSQTPDPAEDPEQKPAETPGTSTEEKPAETPGTSTEEKPAETPGTSTEQKPAETPGTSTDNALPGTPDTIPVVNAIVSVRIDGVDTEYTDMKEAWAAVNGKTAELTLLGDVTTAAAMNTAFVLNSGDVTLDLGGHTWTYQYASGEENKPATFDLIEIKGDASLTVKGSSGSAMVYAGSSTYKGACLYATGNSTLTIEGGTFSSNVAAPIYVDGATLNIKGGIFRAAGEDESAITMNNGTFNMTGGEVQFGKLTLNNTNGSQEANIGGDSTLSGVETKGQNALPITDTLSSGYQYESQDNTMNKVTASSTTGQTGEKISNVVTKAAAISNLVITTDNKNEVFFSYTDETKITLTATCDIEDPSITTVTYNWKVKDPDGKIKELNEGATCEFSSKYNSNEAIEDRIKAGTYTYIVEASYTVSNPTPDPGTGGGNSNPGENAGTGSDPGDNSDLDSDSGEETDEDSNSDTGIDQNSDTDTVLQSGTDTKEYPITVKPITDGTVTEKTPGTYKKEYVYEDEVMEPVNGGDHFEVDSYVPSDVKLKWSYTIGGESIDNPLDAGRYTVVVTAQDAENYTATGEFAIVVDRRPVTPKMDNSPTKVYDGTTDVKDAKIVLVKDSGDELSYNTNELVVGSCIYDTAEVGEDKRITVSGIKWNESSSKMKNYLLMSTECQGTGSITHAKLILNISAEPERPEINKPVTITVTVLNDDINRTPNDALTADDLKLSVSGGDEPAPTLRSAGTGIFTGEYTTSTKGDRSFSVKATVSDNYSIKNADSAQVTFIEVIPKSAIAITVNKESITYGDDATFTATVTKVDGQDGDELNGGVQFYLDGEESANKIGTAQSIKVSGDKATVTLSRSELTAGDHKIMAQFTSDDAEGSKAEGTVKVEKKPLTWNTSGLTASKTAGNSDEVTVYGTLSVDGILDGEIKFVQPDVMKTKGFKNTDAGTYTVSIVPESGDWTFDPKEPENYALPEDDPQIKATVNALKELSNPPAARDGNTYRLVMEEGLSEVPEGLKNTSFNTPAKIEQELKRILTSTGSYSEENIAVYDVKLQVTTDDGKTWEDANADNFPTEGVKVTLPYPGGTGRYTHNFAVAHMFGESLFGHTSGTVEVPSVTKADNGLEFTVTGLSPIAVAWTDASNAATSPVGNAVRRLLGVQTGDESPIVLYAGMAGACVLVLVILVVVFAVRRKKKMR